MINHEHTTSKAKTDLPFKVDSIAKFSPDERTSFDLLVVHSRINMIVAILHDATPPQPKGGLNFIFVTVQKVSKVITSDGETVCEWIEFSGFAIKGDVREGGNPVPGH